MSQRSIYPNWCSSGGATMTELEATEAELKDIEKDIIRTEISLEGLQIELDMCLKTLKRLKEKKKFLEMMP